MRGKRADRIIIDDPAAETPPEGRQDHASWWGEDTKTLADCRAKFDNLERFRGFARPRPQTVEEFNRLYLCQWPPAEDDQGGRS